MLGKPHIYPFFQTCLVNSIKHEHSCKILYVHIDKQYLSGQRAQWLSGLVFDMRVAGFRLPRGTELCSIAGQVTANCLNMTEKF